MGHDHGSSSVAILAQAHTFVCYGCAVAPCVEFLCARTLACRTRILHQPLHCAEFEHLSEATFRAVDLGFITWRSLHRWHRASGASRDPSRCIRCTTYEVELRRTTRAMRRSLHSCRPRFWLTRCLLTDKPIAPSTTGALPLEISCLHRLTRFGITIPGRAGSSPLAVLVASKLRLASQLRIRSGTTILGRRRTPQLAVLLTPKLRLARAL